MSVPRQASGQPQCGSDLPENYNLPLQVGGLFLILVLSAFSCSFPVMVVRFSWLRAPRQLLWLCKHLGTGVILATVFVHLIPTAYSKLLDPCLSDILPDRLPAVVGLIMLIGALVVPLIELILASWNLGHSHQSDLSVLEQTGQQERASIGDSAIEMGPAHSHPGAEHEATASGKPDSTRQLLQCWLIEGGIIFHSIFIGMAIALSANTQLVVLLTAICFHQIFEGLALGSRIAAITTFGRGSVHPWLMALGFGFTAPTGQAIGIGIHTWFDLESRRGLLTVGVANAFSR